MTAKKRDNVDDAWVVVQGENRTKRMPSAWAYLRYFGKESIQAVKYERVRREMRPSGLKKKLALLRN